MDNQNNLLLKEKAIKQNRIWVRIASACNNKCVFCLDSNAHDWTFPKEEIIKKQLEDWFKPWYENRAIISWWEASINPKFPEYIRYAKELWYDRVQTVTNWNMFALPSFCKKVFGAWLEEVTFSFHWHNSKLHDYLVDTPNAFNKSLKWLIYIKKYYPNIIINIDIVVNKINVAYLPDIVKIFMRLWVYEYDILQIIPFWRWFQENREKLFYNIEEYSNKLLETWKLSKIPWMYMWTNRFPAEAFEWFEDLIQDPRKIKSEVMWEWIENFESFILTNWEEKQQCYKDNACSVCFIKQYCYDYIKNQVVNKIDNIEKYYVLRGENFPSDVFEKYWKTLDDFKNYLNNIKEEKINIPKCLWWSWIFQTYNDLKDELSLKDYTEKYISDLYRKKSLRCRKCEFYNECEWIHINFIRSYWFKILNPIK